jgi:predicted lactoylglutathione lyase
VSEASKSAEMIVALSFDSKAKVDELVDKAMKAGAGKSNDPQDQGFMYTRSFQDLDGHLWEFFHMDPAAIPAN